MSRGFPSMTALLGLLAVARVALLAFPLLKQSSFA
jgi:hypothetical protein